MKIRDRVQIGWAVLGKIVLWWYIVGKLDYLSLPGRHEGILLTKFSVPGTNRVHHGTILITSEASGSRKLGCSRSSALASLLNVFDNGGWFYGRFDEKG